MNNHPSNPSHPSDPTDPSHPSDQTDPKPRRHVRLFQPQFAPLVASGRKRCTIRPTPKNLPIRGDRISLRAWTGKPYRSKQRILGEATITHISTITIDYQTLIIDGRRLNLTECEQFARADGFTSWFELAEWFEKTHTLPFTGIILHWTHPSNPNQQIE